MSGPDTLLADRYRLDTRIGAGGMGEVWRATDTVLGRTVAVKLMRAELVAEAGFAERFLAEARTMATIRHRGVVAVHDFHGDAAGAFLVMEHVEGESLADVLHRVGSLEPERAMRLLAQAAEALQAAHDKGVVHRDIKPGNLLVAPDDTLVLTDFGIARSAANNVLTATGAVVGTPSYLAPEQVLGQPATTRSDVYALGVVAYECLTGRRPFDGENLFDTAMRRLREPPPALGEATPPAANALVARALDPEPERRWPTAREFGAAARHAGHAPDHPHPDPPTAQSAQPPQGTPPGTPPGPAAGHPAPTRRDYLPGRAAPAQPVAPTYQSPTPPPAGQPPAGQPPAGQPPAPPPPYPAHPPPWAAPRRPVVLTIAALLLAAVAASMLFYSLATLAVLDPMAQASQEMLGTGQDYRDVTRVTLLVLIGALGHTGLVYLLLAVQVFRGRRGSRAWAYTLGVPLLCCCTPGWWYAQLGNWTETDAGAEFAGRLGVWLPDWYEPLTGPVAAVGMVCLLFALLLLMLPPVGRYIRRPPPYPYPPYHHG